MQCLNNFEVGFANHVMEMANLSNLLPSACFQAVTIIPTKVYRNSSLLMLLSHHSMVAPSRGLSRFLSLQMSTKDKIAPLSIILIVTLN